MEALARENGNEVESPGRAGPSGLKGPEQQPQVPAGAQDAESVTQSTSHGWSPTRGQRRTGVGAEKGLVHPIITSGRSRTKTAHTTVRSVCLVTRL